MSDTSFSCGCSFDCGRDFKHEGRRIIVRRENGWGVPAVAAGDEQQKLTFHAFSIDGRPFVTPVGTFNRGEEKYDAAIREYVDSLIRQRAI